MPITSRCSSTIYRDMARTQCLNPAKVTENDKPYCTIHAPSYRKAKRAERNLGWERNLEARKAIEKQVQERDRRAACFPDLLAALEWALKVMDRGDGVLEYTGPIADGERARAAMAKATSPNPQ